MNMKKLVALILMSSSLYAFTGSESNEATTVIVDQTQVNTLVNNPVSTFSSLGNNNKTASAGGDIIKTGDISLVNIPLAYKVSDKWGISAAIPYIRTSFSGASETSGLGDVSIAANYLDVKDKSNIEIIEARLKLASGDYNKATGSGASSFFFSYTKSKQVESVNFIGAFSYTANAFFKNSSLGTALHYGDTLALNIGVSSPSYFSDKVTRTIRFSYLGKEEDEWAGVGANNAMVNADVWVDWKSDNLIADIPVKVGIKIPLQAISNSTIGTDKTVLFYISAAGLFDK